MTTNYQSNSKQDLKEQSNGIYIYRSEMSNQTKNIYLNYLIDPKFTNVNSLFVLLFENEHENDDEDESVRTSFKKFYVICNTFKS